MANEAKLDLLMSQYESVHMDSGWVEFRTVRAQQWDPLIRRRKPQNLEAVAKAYGSQVDVESPDLEKALQDWIAAMMVGDTKVDSLCLDEGETAKKDVEDLRIWTAGSLLEQNKARRFDRERLEQMARYGVTVAQKTWENIEEPEAPDMEEGETEAAYAKRALKMRDQYFARAKHPFGRIYVSPLQMSWFPVEAPENIELFFKESSVSYVEAKKLQTRLGNKLKLSKDSKAMFVADGVPVDELNRSDWSRTRVTVLTRAMRHKKTGRWSVDEWVRESHGGEADWVEMDSYEVPFDHAPFFVAEGGDTLTTESNPHLRYRPIIYPLIVDVQELNAMRTLLTQLAIKKIRDEDVYVDLSSLPDRAAGLLQEWGLIEEGSGAKKRLVFKRPAPGSGEIMAVPRLERWPNDIDAHLLLIIQMVQESIREHKPNRFMLGQAEDTLRESPATSFLQQAEAAGIGLSGYLRHLDEMTRQWLVAEHEAIVTWDEGSDGVSKPYRWRVTGDEPVLRNPREAGDGDVELTADMIRDRSYLLKCLTRNETQGEHALNVQLADVAYEKQSITESEWLKRRGSDDPEKQQEALWKDKQGKIADAEFQPVLTSVYRNYLSALSGLNLGLMMGDAGGGMPSPGGSTPPPPPGAPPPSPGARTFATPGAIAGPSGGSSGASFG